MTVILRRFGPLVVIAALVAVALASGATDRLNLAELGTHRQAMGDFVASHLPLSLLIFTTAYVAMAATALPGPLIFTITAGLLFGHWIGSLAALVGATTGSVVLFLACRSAFGGVLRRRAGPRLAAVEAAISGHIFEHVLILRLLPVFPLGVVTVGAGLLGARLAPFTAATLLGMVPSTLIYTAIGSGLNRVLDQGGRLTPGLLADPQIILPLAGLGVLAAARLALRGWRWWRARRMQPPA